MLTRRQLLAGVGAVGTLGNPTSALARTRRATPLGVGSRAPRFRLRTMDRTLVRLGDYLGSPIILDFFRTDCLPCRRALPELVDLSRRFEKQGVIVLLVALLEETDGKGKLNTFLAAHPVPFPVLVDETDFVSEKYLGKSASLPATFLVGRQGRIAARQLGAPEEGAFAGIEPTLRRILS